MLVAFDILVLQVLPSSVGQNLVPGSTLGIITTSSGIAKPAALTGIPTPAPGLPGATPAGLGTAVRTPNGQIMMMTPAATMQPLARPTAGELWVTNKGVQSRMCVCS